MERLIEFATRHWLLVAAFVVTGGALVWSFVAPALRRYREVGPLEATTLINREDAVVLDVREPHEFREGHIAGAVSVPLARLRERLDELARYRGRPLVVVCRSGSRAPSACALLARSGFGPVYHLAGGMLAWERANLPVRRK
ncbi:rhodanese-like domain-containing protein [Inmirania thermothiophila]|uniref:Rhodanese-related sulfurtransferase n=1 Tax=Inmirania thermothiophila TaxID=1750597 RepID=A0A3N1Y5X6_9GAMM|nr:rhodanese-like domain-containing protein [Inmirania thermothiophila]ROR34216.1 rhodanese-related sulfurtransferase [Inmirania thermothiophila]